MNIKKLSFRGMRRQAGATLLELTMAIGIIATISIAAIAYFNTSNDSNRIKDEINNLNTLSGAVRNMFNSQGNYLGLNNAVILRSNAFPDRMRVPGNTTQIKHAWRDNGVTVAPTNFLGTANDSFTITYSNVPARACSDLVSRTMRYYDQVTVGSTVVTNVGAATTACGSTGTTTVKFITR